MYSKILVAHERMIDTTHALDKAAALAVHLQAELFVLGILEPDPIPLLNLEHRSPDNLMDSPEMKQLQKQAEAWATKQRVQPRIETHVGKAVRLIEHFAQQFGADLLILGDINHTGTWGGLLEHSAERIGLHTGCDVLVIR